ncbi:MAG: hypothetical protein ACYC0A_06060 [Lutibacter sp.]
MDASNDPYWKDAEKIENGRPFFKKYIPIIKQIAGAGWEPVTEAVTNVESVRIERFGDDKELFFTVRNNGNKDVQCVVSLNLEQLKIFRKFSATELVGGQPIKVDKNKLHITIPVNRTQVIQILQ